MFCGFACHSLSNILVIGDSLSAAYSIELSEGWVNLLKDKLKVTHPNYEIINASTSGHTTTDGVERLPSLLEKYHPSIVIIGLGSNDGLRGIPTKVIEQNLDSMVKLSLANKSKVLLLGFLIPMNYGPIYRNRFEQVFKDVSMRYQLTEVPFLLKGIALKPELMQTDGLHPKAIAQPIILETVWPYLQKLL
jgi:acyl-CoA thioesterase-1